MDKKLTDSEILKALECCASGEVEECKNCPYVEGYPYCDGPMERDVLDLINRLQEEKTELLGKIEKSNSDFDKLLLEKAILKGDFQLTVKGFKEKLKTAKAEAYKEIAESIQGEIDDAIHSNHNAKEERQTKCKKFGIPIDAEDSFLMYCDGKIKALSGINSYIDNLLKELVGEDNFPLIDKQN